MKEQLITLETAKLAKEKGLKLNYCRKLFYPDVDVRGKFVTNECIHNYKMIENKDWYSRPTQALLQKWLREKHNIQVSVVSGTVNGNDWIDWTYSIKKSPSVKYTFVLDMRDGLDSYEEALEEGLFQALKFIEA